MSGRRRRHVVVPDGSYSSDSIDSDDMDEVADALAMGSRLHRSLAAGDTSDTEELASLMERDTASSDGDSADYGGRGFYFWDEPPTESRYGPNLFFAPFKDGAFGEQMAARRRAYAQRQPAKPWVSPIEHSDNMDAFTDLFYAASEGGRTLLHYAVASRRYATVDALLGVDDDRGLWARVEDCKKAAALLILASDSHGLTALHYAALLDHDASMMALLNGTVQMCRSIENLGGDDAADIMRPHVPRGATPEAVVEAVLTHQAKPEVPSVLALAAAVSDSLLDAIRPTFAANGGSFEGMMQRAHAPHTDTSAAALDPPLVYAASVGRTHAVQNVCTILQRAAEEGSGRSRLLCTGSAGETALHRAAVCGHESTFEALVLYKPLAESVLAPAPEGWLDTEGRLLEERWRAAALAVAAYEGDDVGVRELLEKGAKIDLGVQEPDTAVHAAALTRQATILRTLIRTVRDGPKGKKRLAELLEKADRSGLLPLHCPLGPNAPAKPLSHSDRVELRACMRALLEAHKDAGVAVDVRTATTQATPLVGAANLNDTDVIRQLLAAGADVNAVARRDETPLMSAAMAGSVDALKALLEAGADVHAVTWARETVLHLAVSEGLPSERELDVVRALLAAGADPHVQDADGRTVVDWAAELQRADLLKVLLQSGGSLDWASNSGYDAFAALFKPEAGQDADTFSLRDAQLSSEHAAAAVELARGRDVRFVGSLVNCAIGEGFNKMAAAILEDHKLESDADGNTLLMHATLNGWDFLVKHLVYLEWVDVEARNAAGATAIEIAVERGEWESFLDLYGAGAKPPDCANAELMLAAALHEWRKVEAILQRLVREQERSEAAAAANGAGSVDLAIALAPAGTSAAPAAQQPNGAATGRALAVPAEVGAAEGANGMGEAPPAKRLRPSAEDGAPSTSAEANGQGSGGAGRSQRVTRAGTPVPPPAPGPLGRSGLSAVGTGAENSGVMGVHAPRNGASGDQVGAGPSGRSQPGVSPLRTAQRRASAAQGQGRPSAAPPEQQRLDVSSLTWLITLLMHPREAGSEAQHVGQPSLAMRDRLLVLLRPMMNFQEKVAFFHEEQDHLLEYRLDALDDDETLHIDVHRGDDVLVDTVHQIVSAADDDGLARELTVSFVDEQGEDGGGVLKEFCQELAAVLIKPDTAVFKEVPESSGCYQPSEKACVHADSVDVNDLFRALGIVVAKAVCARACFPMRFTQSFLKQMLGEELDVSDLKDVDPQLHSGLMAYLSTPLAELGMTDETFTAEVHYFGKTETAELKPGGASIAVTDANKEEYVRLLASFKMTESIKAHVKAFCDGLWSCIALDSLRVFSPEQLGLLISGRPDVSVKEMQAAIKYDGFGADDATIKWLWELVREMSQADVAQLLAFITGSPRVPATGFKGMRTPLTITRASTMRMPSAHTCANQLVLSEYADKASLRHHLQEALKQPAAFHFR